MTSSKITALLQPPDKKGRVDIYADGEYLMSVSEDAALEAGLKVGLEVDEAFISEIEHSVQLTRAKNKAYTYLSYGDMSEKKLLDKLKKYGFSESIACECVEKLKELGYIDNSRYAAALAESLAGSRLYGPRRILQELRLRGIDEQLSRAAVDALETDFEQSIKRLARGRLKRNMSDPKEVQKLIAALMRNGYGYDMIRSALSDMLCEEEEYE